ncbi:electron transfer flavoprotein subunit beta [Celerinatantimonas sp. YJH-8]|uniref:electron transfer flavoprotein subunit beta n=1 Tax=Celerinatantimonas sp. YJH-8 TaxID=3228714 RepID=UPI0038C11B13
MPHKLNLASLRISALVGMGRHPLSGRERRAPTDARAVELGLRLAPQALEVLHVGDPQHPGLNSYAGMGLATLRVLSQSEDADAVPALVDYLREQSRDIILTGMQAERGESSGMLPYLLAEQLGCPVVTGITEIRGVADGVAEVLQAQPRGQRRLLKVTLPFVASVDLAAAPPRQYAYGVARRVKIEVLPVSEPVLDQVRADWQASPAKPRPKRLKVIKAKTAAERFKAATVRSQNESGKVMRDESIEAKAQAVFELLLEEGVLR